MDQNLQSKLDKAQSKKAETRKFFRILKKQKPADLDANFHELHEKAFAHIDCLACANCCKTVGPRFIRSDIRRLSKYLKIKEGEFEERYLQIDEDGDWVLQSVPCPFLGADNYCSVYSIRPRACREFPHTDRPKMHEILKETERNARSCPAVAEITEELKKRY